MGEVGESMFRKVALVRSNVLRSFDVMQRVHRIECGVSLAGGIVAMCRGEFVN